MNENDLLEHLKTVLKFNFDLLQKKLTTLTEEDQKFVSLATIQQKIAKSILDCIALQRNPRLDLLPEEDRKNRKDLSRLIRDLDATKQTLMIFKDETRPSDKRTFMHLKKEPHR